MKITFKKQPAETGLARVANPYPTTDIKVDGKVVGHINPPNWKTPDNNWGVSFAVKKTDPQKRANPNCQWRWIRLVKTFNTEPEARLFLKEHLADLVSRLGQPLHCFED